ncbi:MAG: protein kinase [Planctomycetales bacterium]|nr:protein kinase [Planctomycetales bacterium]
MDTGPDGIPSYAFLTDFGLAKSVSTGSRLTRTGQALGTPAYMSPEQARGEIAALTPATDVWSLGCVLYEMLAGRPPFGGATNAALIAGILTQEPRPIRPLRPDVPRTVQTVLQISMVKGARARYGDGAALRDDLDRVLRGERPQASVPGRRRGRAAAAAIAGAIAFAAGVWAIAGRRAPPGPLAIPALATPAEAERLLSASRSLRQSDPAQAARFL